MQLVPFTGLFFGSAFVFAYKIFGLQPGIADGLVFNSCVPNLQGQPELWLDECPYLQPRLSSRFLAGLRVELVQADDAAFVPSGLPQQSPQLPLALAA